MELGTGMVKKGVTITSNPRRNVRPRGIAIMARKSLIKFDKLVLI